MSNRPLRAVVSLMSGGVFQIAANAGAALIATKLLPAEERGIMVLCLTVVALVSVVCAGGTGNVLRSMWSKLPSREQKGLAAVYGTASMWSAAAAMVIALAVTLVLAYFITPDLASPGLLLATAVGAASQVLLLQVSEAFFAAGRFKEGSAWAALSAVTGLVGVVAVGLTMPTAEAMTGVQAVGTLAVELIAIWALKSTGTFAVARGVRFGEVVQFIRQGLLTMGLPIGFALITRIDRLILGFFIAPSVLAVYALAVTLAEGIRLAPTAISQLATHSAAEGNGWSSSWKLQKYAIAASILAAVGLTVGVYFLAVPVFGQEFAATPLFVLIVSVAEIGYSLLVVSTRGMIGAGWLRDASTITGLSGFLSVAAYLVGSLFFGVIGCCVARVFVMLGGGIWAATVFRSRFLRQGPEESALYQPRHLRLERDGAS